MNNKGFTLVELIAMMVVISVLMMIAVPNISGILKKNRESMSIENINSIVGTAQSRMESKDVKKISNGECVLFTLGSLDGNNDIKEGINGGEYDKSQSVVVVSKSYIDETNSISEYKYYVGLLELKETKRGTLAYYTQHKDGSPALVDYKDISSNSDSFIPKASKEDYSEYYMDTINNLDCPDCLRTYINDYAGSDICDKVVSLYTK